MAVRVNKRVWSEDWPRIGLGLASDSPASLRRLSTDRSLSSVKFQLPTSSGTLDSVWVGLGHTQGVGLSALDVRE